MFLYNLPVDMLPRRGRIYRPEKSLSEPMHLGSLCIADTVAEANRDAAFPLMNTLAQRPELELNDGTVFTHTTSTATTRSQELPR